MELILARLDGHNQNPFVLLTPDNPRIEVEFLVGRAVDCNVVIPHDFVSRHHCGVVVNGSTQGVRVRDLGSRNGTSVNGRRISGMCDLQDGDRLTVGPVPFEIRFCPDTSLWDRASARCQAACFGTRRVIRFGVPGEIWKQDPGKIESRQMEKLPDLYTANRLV